MSPSDKRLNPQASHFLEEVADWLLANGDKRLVIVDGDRRIDQLYACCAEFCLFLAGLEARGIPTNDWRNHLT